METEFRGVTGVLSQCRHATRTVREAEQATIDANNADKRHFRGNGSDPRALS
jgi:hypothetical protein